MIHQIVSYQIILLPILQDTFAMTVTKKQSGRKRWGGPGLSDTWDDWNDFDLGNSTNATKKIPPIGGRLHNKENEEEDDILGWVTTILRNY